MAGEQQTRCAGWVRDRNTKPLIKINDYGVGRLPTPLPQKGLRRIPLHTGSDAHVRHRARGAGGAKGRINVEGASRGATHATCPSSDENGTRIL